VKRFLKLGGVAGAAGGVALAVFLLIVGESSIEDAIALERARAAGQPAAPHHQEMFSRTVQHVGGGIGALLYGVAMGLIFAVVLAAVRHRMTSRTDWHRATTLAAVGFVSMFLVPFLKYPSNPPSVGDPSTITRRTLLYLAMLAWSVVATVAAWRLLNWARQRSLSLPIASTATVALWSLIVTIGFIGLPGSPDPVDAPATLIWRFRLASVGGSVVFWAVSGMALGWLLFRADRSALESTSADRGALG
jgi:predicted cobalt transporter CbtA